MGLDATIPWIAPDGHQRTLEERLEFLRVDYEPVDLVDYLGDARRQASGDLEAT
jgi:hypothetical protein